jgi:hypothetical protein
MPVIGALLLANTNKGIELLLLYCCLLPLFVYAFLFSIVLTVLCNWPMGCYVRT